MFVIKSPHWRCRIEHIKKNGWDKRPKTKPQGFLKETRIIANMPKTAMPTLATISRFFLRAGFIFISPFYVTKMFYKELLFNLSLKIRNLTSEI